MEWNNCAVIWLDQVTAHARNKGERNKGEPGNEAKVNLHVHVHV